MSANDADSGSSTSSLAGTTSTTPRTETTTPQRVPSTIKEDEDKARDGWVDSPLGFSLTYPEGWQETDAAIGTQFSEKAQCVAVQIIDDAPPPDSGQAGFLLHAAVQVCAMPVAQQSLTGYMESVYGSGIPGFSTTELGGLEAYRHDEDLESLIYVHIDPEVVQIATAVATKPELEAIRLRQVEQILDSIQFD